MSEKKVILASVPAEHLASAQTVPLLEHEGGLRDQQRHVQAVCRWFGYLHLRFSPAARCERELLRVMAWNISRDHPGSFASIFAGGNPKMAGGSPVVVRTDVRFTT